MNHLTKMLFKNIINSRLFAHRMFYHWAFVDPPPNILGAAFHQIQMFCASTRSLGAFSDGLSVTLGLDKAASLMREISEGETGHGEKLAIMAAHIINKKAEKIGISKPSFPSDFSRENIERMLKENSDLVLSKLPGYEFYSGLAPQTRQATQVFQRRNFTKESDVLYSLGAALALEITSNRHIIPGEKYALVDSGHYGVTLEDMEMLYLKEHFGECGAEALHERNVIEAVSEALSRKSEWYVQIEKGVDDFLEALSAMWDLIDAALFQSGYACRLRPSFPESSHTTSGCTI